MLSIYKSELSGNLNKINTIQNGCWINMINPTDEEAHFVSNKLNIPLDFLKAALDEEEGSRIEIEDGCILVIIDIPITDIDDNSLTYDTYPLAIIHSKDNIVTVSLKDSNIICDFEKGKIQSFYSFKRSRFMLQILFRAAKYFLLYLRQINKKSLLVEKSLYKSIRNRELFQLLSLQKSLVYFSTSLKSNEATLQKLLKLEMLKKYDEDTDLLEDVIIETRQAIEMCNIYSDVLSSTTETFASIISNNQNMVMKFLTSVTIVLSIPTLISGVFGMNVSGIPFTDGKFGFFITVLIILVITVCVALLFNKKDMF
ncbi:magnesium transporter CorA family protein [Clostridium senegalense]|uniref:magnesium transporter CorA family protein n=1 Tax=Clostridium senegalense TaxID=1465809 RepID=UPI0002887318|nr:magnesium transporter CorA family protein [Clostridium senegalense]MBU5226139.1 magnesium transporter CorA family protein [Clostridium senegalense]